jgi:hypothetical protein
MRFPIVMMVFCILFSFANASAHEAVCERVFKNESSVVSLHENPPQINGLELKNNILMKLLGAILKRRPIGDLEYADFNIPFYSKNRITKIYNEINEKLNQSPALSLDEKLSIYLYTDHYWSVINSAIRGNKLDILEKLKPLIFNIQSGLQKLPVYRGTVYRGIQANRSFTKAKYLLKRTVTFSEFTSTSTSTDVESLLGIAYSDFPVVFVIQSKTGRLVGENSANPHEDEVLFGMNTKFKVHSIEDSQNSFGEKILKIYLEEIP